jgi:hypothetical protein
MLTTIRNLTIDFTSLFKRVRLNVAEPQEKEARFVLLFFSSSYALFYWDRSTVAWLITSRRIAMARKKDPGLAGVSSTALALGDNKQKDKQWSFHMQDLSEEGTRLGL